MGRGNKQWRVGYRWAMRYLGNLANKGACDGKKQSKEEQGCRGAEMETKRSSRTGKEGGIKATGKCKELIKITD